MSVIHGILAKYESTEQGFTITVKADHEQAQAILPMHKKEIIIQPVQTEIPADKSALLTDILASLNVIRDRVEKEL